MKYRKKPVVIEAIQWTGENQKEIERFMKTGYLQVLKTSKTLMIPTLEGDMQASSSDWIIKGVQGEFYPCKPVIFEQTYEEV